MIWQCALPSNRCSHNEATYDGNEKSVLIDFTGNKRQSIAALVGVAGVGMDGYNGFVKGQVSRKINATLGTGAIAVAIIEGGPVALGMGSRNRGQGAIQISPRLVQDCISLAAVPA
jgi:hypothetical protein